MRKLISILLLGLMLQYSFGLHIVYSWNSFITKQSMKTAIANGSFHHKQVVRFTLPIQQLSGSSNTYLQQDEIELDGKMYDIVSSRQQGSCITVQAICDDDETGLINTYQQVMGGKHQSLPDKDLTCLKNFFSPFIICGYQSVSHQTLQYEKSRMLHIATTFPVKLYSKVLKPPPRFA